jgi:hypothetical protein
MSGAPWWILLAIAALQVVALLARSEAWHLTIAAAGGRIERRVGRGSRRLLTAH